jgi:hypothetical protein
MKRTAFALLMCLAATACGPADSDHVPGGVSVEDARALDEAAAKLDTESLAVENGTNRTPK